MSTLQSYSKNDETQIINVFSIENNRKAKEKLASEMGRSFSSLQQKYSKLTRKKKVKVITNSPKKEVIQVTHLNKNIEKAVIQLGDAKVTIYSSKFKVNGLEIEC